MAISRAIVLCVTIGVGVLWALNFIGTLQTAQSVLANRGPIMRTLGALLGSQALQLVVFAVGAFLLIALHLGWLDAVQRRFGPQVTLEIDDVVIQGGDLPRPVLQLTVRARNSGAATMLDDWRLVMHWRGESHIGTHLLGRPPVPDFQNLQHLDEQVSATSFQGTKAGLVFFGSPLSGPSILEAIRKRDKTFLFQVIAKDSNGREWSGTQSLIELADRGVSTLPIKR